MGSIGTSRGTLLRRGALRLAGATALLGALAACEKELILPGERFDTRADLTASIPTEGQPAPTDTTGQIENRSVPISLPAAQSNAEWTQRSGNARHLAPHGALSANPQPVWSVRIGAGNSRKQRITAAPVVAGGRVFTIDSGSTLTATSTGGGPLWSVNLAPPAARGVASGGGLAVSGPLVFATTGHSEVVALDAASGTLIWRQKLASAVAGAPTVEGNTLYVTSRDGTGWALSTTAGKVQWQYQGTPSVDGFLGSAAPALTDRLVLFPMSTGELIAVEKAGGAPVWVAPIAGERRGRGYANIADITGDPVISGAVTYVGNAAGRTAALTTETGLRLWTAKDAAYGPVLPVGDSVFLVNDEARLVRLDASSGETIWSVEMPYFVGTRERKRAAITAHYGPYLAGGRLVVASGDGQIRFFNPASGAPLGGAELPGGAASAPAMAGGVLYVVSRNGQLHAFR